MNCFRLYRAQRPIELVRAVPAAVSASKGAPLSAALDTAFCESALTAEEQAMKIQEYFSYAAELGWFCKQQDSEAS